MSEAKEPTPNPSAMPPGWEYDGDLWICERCEIAFDEPTEHACKPDAATGAPGEAATVSKSVVRRIAAMTRPDPAESIYGLFHADGFECKTLLGVFLDVEEAQKVGDEISCLLRLFHEEHLSSIGPQHSIISVKPLTIGEYSIPADAAYMQEENAKRK